MKHKTSKYESGANIPLVSCAHFVTSSVTIDCDFLLGLIRVALIPNANIAVLCVEVDDLGVPGKFYLLYVSNLKFLLMDCSHNATSLALKL